MAIGYGCAIAGGFVQCWGNNLDGQLGNGSTSQALTPQCVVGLPNTRAVAVGAGTFQTCALLADGTTWCWGANDSGELGIGVYGPSASLTAVQVKLPPPPFKAVTLGVGPHYACVTGQDGSVWCWGANDLGQLGSTTTSSCGAVPCAPAPQRAGVSGATTVSAGTDAACALLMGGAVQCWGNNEFGQIGNGTVSGPLPPSLVTGLSATAISAGSGYACATLASTGGVVCWGENYSGQFADGTTNSADTFQVSQFGTDNLVPVTALSAGLDHTCAASPRPGAIYCAGDNLSGDLGVPGIDMEEDSLQQVQDLPAGATPVAVAAGGNEATCALLVGSNNAPMVMCWGKNGGQLGDATTADSVGIPVTAPLAHCP